MSESLDSVLSRVLQNASEKVAQRIQPTINRRPLKDPHTNAVGFFQDISEAVRSMRSPEVAGALQSHAMMQTSLSHNAAGYGSSDDGSDSTGFPSSPADRSRRTTIGDDATVLGEIANSTVQIVRQVTTAGKAIGQFTGNTAKLDSAVSGMARTVVAADKELKASKPTEGFMGWLRSLTGRASNATSGNAAGSGTPTAGSASGSWLDAFSPTRFVRGFGGKQTGSVIAANQVSSDSGSSSPVGSGSREDRSSQKDQGKSVSWLESSSIADSVRGFFGMFRISPAQMVGMNKAASGGSVPLSQQDHGSGSGESFVSRISQSLDRALAKSSVMFRQMNRQSRMKGDDGDEKERWLNSSSIADSVRGFTRKTVSRLGRRALNSKALRQRVVNGQRLIRGRVQVMPAGGGGGAGGAAAGGGFGTRMGGMFGGLFGGGAGAGAAGAGGGAAGAGGGGAAAGGGMAGGAAVAGVALVFVAIVAAAAMAVQALYKLGMQGYETALRVSQFNGQLAAAKAQLDVSRMLRDVQTANSLSESGKGFMEALNKLEETLRPITDGAMKAGLEFMTVVLEGCVFALRSFISGIAGTLGALNEFEKGLGGNMINDALVQKLEDMAAGRVQQAPGVGQRGFFDGQMADRPLRQPRAPLPPMGGGNGL